MTPFRTLLALLLLVAPLTACGVGTPGTIAPALSAEQQRAWRVAEVSVTVPETARIWWGEGDLQVAAAAGVPASDIGATKAYAASPAGQAALREAVRGRLQAMADRLLTNALGGGAPAHLAIRVSEVYVASHAQILAVSGEHHLSGAAQLFDQRTGAPLTRPQFMRGDAEGGTGFVGVIVDATRNDALGRAVLDLVRNTLAWLNASGPVETPWPAEAATPVTPLPAPVASGAPAAS